LHIPEAFGYSVVELRGAVDNDWQQEGAVGCDQVRPADGQLPFKAEVTLRARVGAAGNDRDEEGATLDLPPNCRIPRIPAPQLALVEPYLDSPASQDLADAPRGGGIFGRIAQKDCPLTRARSGIGRSA
jgi:hypothetical protein